MASIKEECLELKKATFYSDRIVLHKIRGDITIDTKEIYRMEYARATLENYIFASTRVIYPGRLVIWLKMPHKGRKSSYAIKMKHIDFLRIPFEFKRRVSYLW